MCLGKFLFRPKLLCLTGAMSWQPIQSDLCHQFLLHLSLQITQQLFTWIANKEETEEEKLWFPRPFSAASWGCYLHPQPLLSLMLVVSIQGTEYQLHRQHTHTNTQTHKHTHTHTQFYDVHIQDDIILISLSPISDRCAALFGSLARSLTPEVAGKWMIRCFKTTSFCPIVQPI